MRSILGCEGVVVSAVDSATALAATRALLASSAKLRDVLDARWCGITLRLQSSGEAAGRSSSRQPESSGVGASSRADSSTAGGTYEDPGRESRSRAGPEPSPSDAQGSRADGSTTGGAYAAQDGRENHSRAGTSRPEPSPNDAKGSRADGSTTGGAYSRAGGSTTGGTYADPLEHCVLVDGAAGGAQILLAGELGAAAAAAFAWRERKTLKLAQTRALLIEELCTRLGCAGAFAIGIGEGRGAEQVFLKYI